MSASALPRRLPGLDLVRGLAALTVAVSHLIETGMPELHEHMANANNVMGKWGVGIFFLVSGFCIHAPTVRAELEGRDEPLDLREFYRRRFTRLYPAHLVALILSIAVAAVLPLTLYGTPLVPGGPQERTLLSVTTLPQLAAHLFMVHTLSWSAIFTANSVLWTLAIETHFYLAYPLFLALRRRFGTARVLVVLMLFSAALTVGKRFLGGPPLDLVYVNAPYRWWEWILGCLLVERLLTRPPRLRVGWIAATLATLATLAIAIAATNTTVRGLGTLHTIVQPLLFAVAIAIAACARPTGPGSVPGWLLAVGHASYSLYLVHPIAFHLGLALLVGAGAPHAGVVVGSIAAGFLVTWAFYRFVERPFMTRSLGRTVAAAAR